jgi:hypothetical protein
MDNEPQECTPEPIAVAKARLQALVKANAAPRCAAHAKLGQALPGRRYGERALSCSRPIGAPWRLELARVAVIAVMLHRPMSALTVITAGNADPPPTR